MRETVVKPLGLVTEPNKYGVYPPGALSRAFNVFMRSPGILEQATERQLFVGAYGTGAAQTIRLYTTGAQLLAVLDDGTVFWLEDGGTVSAAPLEDTVSAQSFADVVVQGHSAISSALFRDRTLLTSDQAILAADYIDPASTAERTQRYAGFIQPIIHSFALANATLGQALEDNDVVTYAATVERLYADGYLLISEPSPLVRVKCPAGSGPTSISMSVRFCANNASGVGRGGVRADDIVKIWRSPPVQSVGLGLNTESGTTLFLAKTYTLTSTDITNRTATITDDAEPESLTEELYTNPGQEGLASARRRPPFAKSVAVFQGSAFYGNITTPARWVARFPYGLGLLDLGSAGTRARGIGARGFSGTFTNLSTDITGVSAANYVGLAVGQQLGGHANATGRTIAALPGGGIVRMSSAATSTTGAIATLYSVDVVQIGGNDHRIADLQDLLSYNGSFATPATFYSIVPFETIAYRETPSTFGPSILQLVFNQGFALEQQRFVSGSFTVRATNGANYDPPVPEYTATAQTFTETEQPNILCWSWDQQPECVAVPNFLPIGRGEIQATIATRDSLWIWASDGLYRLTGYLTRSSGIGAQWRVDLIDKTLVIARPAALCALRETAYAHTNRGVVRLDNGSAFELSHGLIGDVLPGARLDPASGAEYFMAADDDNNEVWLGVRSASLDTSWYVYNVDTQAFTQYDLQTTTALVFADFLHALAFAEEDSQSVTYPTGTGAGLGGEVVFQPISGGDPLLAKQWIDCTVLFDLASAGETTSVGYAGLYTGTATLIAKQNDSRRTFGVLRAAPAIGHTLAPSFLLFASAAALKFLGLSVRFEVLSEQQVYR